MKKLTIVLAVAGTFYCSAAMAQNDEARPDSVTVNFISKASVGGMKEVRTGRLAETKAQSSNVKAFAARMVSDHTMANAKLMKIAKMEHYNMTPPPASATAPDQTLAQSSGADFDRLYVKMMIMDHKKTIAVFQNEAANGVDPEMKGFAAQTLPTLKMHLADIQSIAKQMGMPTN